MRKNTKGEKPTADEQAECRRDVPPGIETTAKPVKNWQRFKAREERRCQMSKRVMSRSEAASILMDMSRGVSRDECEALQLGVRALVKRHFDCMKNRAKRKEAKSE